MGYDLDNLRKELDSIDKDITDLYIKRLKVCTGVARYKKETGKKIYDAKREEEKLAILSSYVESGFDKKAIVELFRQIMTISRRYQFTQIGDPSDTAYGYNICDKIEAINDSTDKKIVYQGVEGAYSHIATRNIFGKDANLTSADTFADAIDMVEDSKADYAILPLENSLAGAVDEVYNLLISRDVVIVAEYMQPIRHALLAAPGTVISDIKTVYSHPQGFMQCEEFLSEHAQWNKVTTLNTAIAALTVATDNNKKNAAIASSEAGIRYGLIKLASDINTAKNNTTRFAVISKKKIYTKDANKISLMFETSHKSGALYNLLGSFLFNDINMLKLESKAIKDRDWEFRFFVDIEGNLSDNNIKNALDNIKEEASALKILGCYKEI